MCRDAPQRGKCNWTFITATCRSLSHSLVADLESDQNLSSVPRACRLTCVVRVKQCRRITPEQYDFTSRTDRSKLQRLFGGWKRRWVKDTIKQVVWSFLMIVILSSDDKCVTKWTSSTNKYSTAITPVDA